MMKGGEKSWSCVLQSHEKLDIRAEVLHMVKLNVNVKYF